MQARFYRTARGNEPVREWLKSFPKKDKKRIGEDISTIQFGWPVGYPTCRPLAHGIWEARTHLDDVIAQVYFFVAGDTMYLLHGIIKKTQETPKAAIDLARSRKQEIESELAKLRKRLGDKA